MQVAVQLDVMKLLVVIAILSELSCSSLGLYPQESESRIVFDLSGIWNFRVSSSPNQGFDEKWYLKALSEVSRVIFKFYGHYLDNSVIL